GAEPWTGELDRARKARHGQTDWVPHPKPIIKCGNGGSTVDIGCLDSRQDALAAYTLTLIWALTDEQAYADAAIRILDAYSDTLQEVVFESGNKDTYNGPLQAAWLAESFTRSAELLRHHGSSGWSEARAQAFGQMLRRALLPRIQDSWYGSGSNWKTSMGNGVMNIAVYTDDEALFELALEQWRDNLAWSIYLPSDGSTPIGSPDVTNADGTWRPGKLEQMWFGQQVFGPSETAGLVAETCRDFGHSEFTLESLAQSAETAWIQGVDLYAEGEERLMAGHEFLARWLNWTPPPGNTQITVTNAPAWLCGGRLKLQDLPVWEIAYNHYVNRRGRSMPETAVTIQRSRPKGSTTDLHMAWSKLTHAGVGHTTP
ncbi:MAG TPA: alginate lyase family protein, partial [Myxococcaceae bacterium]|nr:alginate lyase family protein [Myxococcaceae bacterium]